MDNHLVLGVFQDKDKAESIINGLESKGYNPEEISIVMKDKRQGENAAEGTTANVASDTASGALTGAVIGGIAGLVGAIIIPGLGAFLIGGPIAEVLGLTGAAAATISGAATGLVAGGIIGALTNLGLSEEEARDYQKKIEAGGILVAVPAKHQEEQEIKNMLVNSGADQVKILEPSRHHLTATHHHKATSHAHHYAQMGAKGGEIANMDGDDNSEDMQGQKGGSRQGQMVNPVQVEKFLKGVNYPASKQDLLDQARKEGADANVMHTLEQIPDREYNGPVGISEAIGQME